MRRDYDNSPQFNSDGQAYMVGLSLNTDLMRGEVSVGQFEHDMLASPVRSTASLSKCWWYVTQLTTITVDARRDADDQIGAFSGEPSSPKNSAFASITVLRNVILTGGVRFGNRDYETIAREDDYNEWDLGADYLLNRNVAVRFRYQHDEVDSPAYRDYEVNQATVGLTLRL
ncbi:MAG: outer membrane beta-barrel protein [Hyphomonadaceae bacterium]